MREPFPPHKEPGRSASFPFGKQLFSPPYFHIADMILTMDFQVRGASNPFAAQETELSEPVLTLKVILGAVIYMVPSVFDRDARTPMLAT